MRLVEWHCHRCSMRVWGQLESEVSIAWMALWHVERAHLDGLPTDPIR
jgi:hypothetical protein